MTIIDRPGTTDPARGGHNGRDAEADHDGADNHDRRRAPKQNVVAEIAARRRADIREEMAQLTIDEHLAIAASTPPPR